MGDDPAATLLGRERENLVVRSAQLEGAGRLQALRLEVQLPVLLAARTRHEVRAERHPPQKPPRSRYVLEPYHSSLSPFLRRVNTALQVLRHRNRSAIPL